MAASIHLGIDEVYYAQFANHLSYNYFDHPPMVAWLIRLTTVNLWLSNDVTIRLGAILCSAAATWVIYCCGCIISNSKTGCIAAMLYNACLYTSVISGTFILPDAPQVLCWLGALYYLLHITNNKSITNKKKRFVLYLGLCVGIGMLCKVHTIFLWFAFGLYCLVHHTQWLKQAQLYIAVGITLVCILPLLYWNIVHDFVTFNYHGGRVNVTEGGINFTSFVQFNAGQFFYQNPIVYIVIIYALVALYNKKIEIRKGQQFILLYAALPLIIVSEIIALKKQVLPHWTGPAYISLILIAAIYLAKVTVISKLPKITYIACTLSITIVISGVLIINYMPKTLGSSKVDNMGANDFTLDMYGWASASKALNIIINKYPTQDAVILTNSWLSAAPIAHYLAEPNHIPILAIGSIDAVHQYYWWNKKVQKRNKQKTVLLIKLSNFNYDENTLTPLLGNTPTYVDTIKQYRSGAWVRYITVHHYNNVVLHY